MDSARNVKAKAQQDVQQIFVSKARVHAGPPKSHQFWNFKSICALLQEAKIDVEEVINWTKAKDGLGYIIYYRGEAASEKKQMLLH